MEHVSAAAPDELVRRHASPGASLLAVLHAIQDETGLVPPEVVAPLARAFNLSRAEVHGVITYYHHFRTHPPAHVTVALCRAEACRSMGVEALARHIESRTGCRFDASRDAGGAGEHGAQPVELESVYCLGQCALSPSMTINGALHVKVTPNKFDALLDEARTRAAAPAENAKENA
ncbi:NAD(P)H-dependent oxidoreductase subunit E [Trinickia sp. Y13]|uniref:NAD(P)H-dependent oxidoreductase subunit E n=1 Tax=Trinickia sp. Y13 TaxID=2917807 RepID=UPI00240615D7|nr:NAD(P)H-dependent oxidoreductase subunit E [Trinickia sp. Y13]MDG0027069.1 NAD(P)H-dependent oxidoreductase subunit E [Trinickia sp. Y13]